jgi:membrane associated rhomboid family serine protease
MNIVTLIIIGVTCIVSFIGFSDRKMFDRYKFNIYAILDLKQIDRLLTSAFLHADTMHLLFNMLTLYFFSDIITEYLGNVRYVIIYLAAILGGNLLSLWMYRRDSIYSAIGASGGVSGILFASIALYPHLGIYIIPIPFPIPGWIYGILYLAYSVYGMKRALGNIGHSAHLGGAVIGLATAVAFDPAVLQYNGLYIGLMLIPLSILGYYVYKGK